MKESPRFSHSRTLMLLSWLSMSAVAISQEAPLEEPVAEVDPALASAGAIEASAQPTVTNVYKNDFSKIVEIDNWSSTDTPRTPSGRRILKLSEQTEFSTGGLPEHEFIRLRLKLVVMGTQDGSDPEYGPDVFSIVPAGATTVMRTTFRNTPPDGIKGIQAYPDDFITAARYEDGTGAEIKSGALGYERGSLYEIELVFPHSFDGLSMQFFYQSVESQNEEYYGLASMEIDVMSGPAIHTKEEFAKMWTALVGRDPAAVNRTMAEFIASGEGGAEYLRNHATRLAGKNDGGSGARMKKLAEEVKKAVGNIAGDDFQERVSARSKLKKLHPDAIPLLEAELKAAKSREARAALTTIIKSLKAKLEKNPAGDHELCVQSRIAKILRTADLAKSGRVIKTSSGWLPKESIDDGYVPSGEITGGEVPRFEFAGSAAAPWNEWVEFAYPEAQTFDFAEVFWTENKSWREGAKLPESWSLVYLEGEEWKPVKLKAGNKYETTFGKMNRVEFEPVKAKKIRINVVEQKGHYSGLYEARIGASKK